MNLPKFRLNLMSFPASAAGRAAWVLPCALALAWGATALAQETPAQPAADAVQPPAAEAQAPAASEGVPAAQAPAQPTEKAAENVDALEPLSLPGGGSAEVTEDQLKQMLVGKDLFLRGGYLGDSISFNADGRLNGHAPFGSYTLCSVRIDKVHLSKHKVELEGARYGLHFLGALPYEDPTKAVDRVRLTPKKKVLKLTIDRETVVKAKQVKGPKPAKGAGHSGKGGSTAAVAQSAQAAPVETGDADQASAQSAATRETGLPAGKPDANTTTSPAQARSKLVEALNNVFAPGVDERLTAHMPKFWKLYYQAVEAKSDYVPADPAVMRQTTVDEKAKLTSTFEPESNEFAQAAGVAGMALYHVVVGPDGKPGEIAVARPIGFGLDENAVASIRKASFSPALKDGKPVAVLLDLVVQFRIYSKRTSVLGTPDTPERAAERKSPGPYSVGRP